MRQSTRIAVLLAIAFVPVRVTAQDVLTTPAADLLRREYLTDLTTLHDKVVALAQAIPEQKYSWRPAPGVRSVSEALMHVAAEWYLWGPHSIGAREAAVVNEGPEAAKKLEKISAKTDVLTHLEASWKYMRTALEGVDPATLTASYKPWNQTLPRATLGMAGDLHEHLGQLIAYARSLDVKPPWTK